MQTRDANQICQVTPQTPDDAQGGCLSLPWSTISLCYELVKLEAQMTQLNTFVPDSFLNPPQPRGTSPEPNAAASCSATRCQNRKAVRPPVSTHPSLGKLPIETSQIRLVSEHQPTSAPWTCLLRGGSLIHLRMVKIPVRAEHVQKEEQE